MPSEQNLNPTTDRNKVKQKWIQLAAEISGLADHLTIPQTLNDLEKYGFDKRAVEMVLYALLHQDPPLLSFEGNAYQWIGPRSSKDEQFRFEMQRRWFDLTNSLKSGKPAGSMEPWYFQKMTENMRQSSKSMMPSVIDYIQKNIPAASKGIDVGGNHGLFSRELQNAGYPMLVVDLPEALAQSTPIDHLEYLGQNLLSGPLETNEKYDWALMVRFIRMLSPNELTHVMHNLSSALQENSKLIVVDVMKDLSETADIVGINMLVNTKNGNIYSTKQLENSLQPWFIRDVSRLSGDYVATLWTRSS